MANQHTKKAQTTTSTSKVSDIIHPQTIFDGVRKHCLIDAFDDNIFPATKAVGLMKNPVGSGWVSYIATLEGDKVIKIEPHEPMDFDGAQMECKTFVQQRFLDVVDETEFKI